MPAEAPSLFTTDTIKRQLADSSRSLAELNSSLIIDNPDLLNSLLEVSWWDKGPWPERASRAVSICVCRFPELLKPHIHEIISRLKDVKTEGARRNLLKILAEVPVRLTKKDKSNLIDMGFTFLTGNYSIAVKVYSMQILYHMSLEIPELGAELAQIIEDRLPEATPGFRSRGSKILRKLHGNNLRRTL